MVVHSAKGRRRQGFNSRRGIVGIESAIVMIAFVIVAAALAFVVLNMGFFTTQQSRAAIQRGLGEASSALELDGTVVAHVNTSAQKIDFWSATIKLSSGQHQVDLTPVKAVISYWSPQRGISLANTYLVAITTPIYDPDTVVSILKVLSAGVKAEKSKTWYNVTSGNFTVEVQDTKILNITGTKGTILTLTVGYNSTYDVWLVTDGETNEYVVGAGWSIPWRIFNGTLFEAKDGQLYNNGSITGFDYNYTVKIGLPDNIENDMSLSRFFESFTDGVMSAVAWITKTNDDTVLDPGEKVLLIMYYKDSEAQPQGYDTIKTEVKVPIGAPLTIERTVPPSLTQEIVDLG